MTDYEYGIMMRGSEDLGLHRGPWTRDDCELWIADWVADVTPKQGERVKTLFYVVRRPVGEWERVDG